MAVAARVLRGLKPTFILRLPVDSPRSSEREFERGAGDEAGVFGGAGVGYRDFVITARAGDHAEFAGGAVGVGAGVEVYLVESNCEREGSVSQGFKLGNGEVGNQVAKTICVEDCSNVGSTGEPGWCDCGAAHGVLDERAEFGWFDARGQVGGDWGEDVAAMEGSGGIREPIV